MILYPAIDLKNGTCVRLYQGKMEQATTFNDNPAAQAQAFQDAGCQWLHVVDLNGAFSGKSINTNSIKDILATSTVSVQLGGGIRDLATMEYWLTAGVQRIILATIAVQKPEIVRMAAREFPGHIAVALDVQGRFIATHGWTRATNITAIDLARRFEDAGISVIITTDIARDGTMMGANIDAIVALAQGIEIPVIASGGVAKIDDLKALIHCGAKIDGVIIGRALYDKAIDLAAAIKLLKWNYDA